MAKKTRKQKQRTTTRRPAGAAPARPAASTAARPLGASAAPEEEEEAAPSAATVLAGTAPTPAPDTARRRVGRIGPAAPPMAPGGRLQRQPVRSARFGSAAALVEPLDSDDPAIPFDRVPYVPSDLRRVATIAALMVVLILIAWAIVSKVVD
jgi:hypothetical protein